MLGERRGELLFTRYRVSVQADEKVLEMDNADGKVLEMKMIVQHYECI